MSLQEIEELRELVKAIKNLGIIQIATIMGIGRDTEEGVQEYIEKAKKIYSDLYDK